MLLVPWRHFSGPELWETSVLRGDRDFCTKWREKNRKQGSKAFVKDEWRDIDYMTVNEWMINGWMRLVYSCSLTNSLVFQCQMSVYLFSNSGTNHVSILWNKILFSVSYRGGGKGVCKRKENQKLQLLFFEQSSWLTIFFFFGLQTNNKAQPNF